MRVVTTCHKEGFEQYGHRVLEGWKHWPKSAELYFYTEDFDIPETPGVVAHPMSHLQSLQKLKQKYERFVAPGYLFDVVKFSHKVFAAVDALSDYKGVGVWMDADCVTFKDIPEGYIENLLDRHYMACFQRPTLYTETGFWVVDCSHPQHQAFMGMWQEWYDSDGFKSLVGWTDCHTLDATIRKFKNLVTVKNLSGEFQNEMHPMAKVELAEYLDHCKGPRKQIGKSPENANR